MVDEGKYCVKCGHRSNTMRKNLAPYIPLRCKQCGAKLPQWDRETMSYIIKE